MERYVVGISGASGIIYGVRLVRALLDLGREVHVIVSDAARLTARYELDEPLDYLLKGARVYGEGQLDAPPSSGSFLTGGMAVAPCSMRTLAAVAHGLEDNLLTRAAMVHLKERRRLVLLIRETPLSTLHIENMLRASSAGAVIMPASPGFYGRPRSVDDLVDSVVGRVLDLLGVENPLARRWAGPDEGRFLGGEPPVARGPKLQGGKGPGDRGAPLVPVAGDHAALPPPGGGPYRLLYPVGAREPEEKVYLRLPCHAYPPPP